MDYPRLILAGTLGGIFTGVIISENNRFEAELDAEIAAAHAEQSKQASIGEQDIRKQREIVQKARNEVSTVTFNRRFNLVVGACISLLSLFMVATDNTQGWALLLLTIASVQYYLDVQYLKLSIASLILTIFIVLVLSVPTFVGLRLRLARGNVLSGLSMNNSGGVANIPGFADLR